MGKRVFLIVLDSAGAGEAPDAADFGDKGCDTIGTCARSGKLHVPHMESLGLYRIKGTSFQKLREASGTVGRERYNGRALGDRRSGL